MIAPGAAQGSTPSLQRLLITICVMMATIMQVLDITIANVSLPYMQGEPLGHARPGELGAHLLRRGGRRHDCAGRLARRPASASRSC